MKRFFLLILGLIITGSIINNIKTQYDTLREAKRLNLKTEKEILKLSEENQILNQKIEYATSSAFVDQEARDKLGIGRENDVWLRLKPEEDIDLFPKINQVEEIPKISQWIRLFTQ
jgi:cell division protein FtsB